MLDYTLDAHHTAVFGMTRSGKTTYVNRYLLNTGLTGHDAPPAVTIIHDDLHRMAYRLQLRPCKTTSEMEAALATRFVAIHPELMFRLDNFKPAVGVPTPAHAAFKATCAWAMNVAQRAHGRKIVCLPEMWRFCTKDSIPLEFAMLAQAGAEAGVELVLDSQTPEKFNPALDGQINEMICFKLISAEALKAVERMGADPDEVKNLPLGSFVAYNRISGAVLRGKVF